MLSRFTHQTQISHPLCDTGETPAFEHSLEKRFTWGNIVRSLPRGVAMVEMVVFLTIGRHHRRRRHQDLLINAKNGRITEVKIFSDSLYPQMIDDLTLALHGA